MKTIVINVLFHLLTARCTYSDWFTISDCSVTCESGFKTEVRSFTEVKNELLDLNTAMRIKSVLQVARLTRVSSNFLVFENKYLG